MIDFDTLCLSGGGIKGLLTLGALHYCQENFLLKNVKTYVGTSVGAMIGYLLAIDYTPKEILAYLCTRQILERIQNFNFISILNGNDGVVSFSPIQDHLEKLTINKIGRFITLKDLKEQFDKTLICTTYNKTQQKIEYLSYENYPDLPCITAIRMSSNLPLLFERYKYMNNYYVDGGVVSNLSVEAVPKDSHALGIWTCLEDEYKKGDLDEVNILEEFYQLLFVPVSQITEIKLQNVGDCFKVMKIPYMPIKIFHFNVPSKDKLNMFSHGFSFAKEFFES